MDTRNTGSATGAIDISEQFLECFELAKDTDRVSCGLEASRFGVTISNARRSFIVRTDVKGQRGKREGRRRRLVTLGHWAPSKRRAADAGIRSQTISVAQARDKAIEAIGGMRAGKDPTADHDIKPEGPTLRDALALHVDRLRGKDGRPSSISSLESETARHVGDWVARPLVSITRTEVRERHAHLTRTSGPYIANRVMRHVRAEWRTAAREHESLPVSPTVACNWNREARRQEPIPWADLPAWRRAVDALPPARRDYNLLVLLTGLRRRDAATIRWEHLDLEARTLHRPVPALACRRRDTPRPRDPSPRRRWSPSRSCPSRPRSWRRV